MINGHWKRWQVIFNSTNFTIQAEQTYYVMDLLRTLQQGSNDEELQLQEEILSAHFQHIFGLQKHDLLSENIIIKSSTSTETILHVECLYSCLQI